MGRTKEFDRDQVLRKAMTVFWKKGYEATSIPDLLEAMGLSRSSLYETFQDKQSLYYEAIQQYKKMSQRKRDVLIAAPTTIEGIRQYFEIHITSAFAAQDEVLPNGCMITNAALSFDAMDEPLQNMVKNSFDELERLFYEKLKRGQETGEISPDKDIRLLSFMLLNLNHSVNVVAKIQQDSTKAREMIEMVLGML
ncbi:TetR/AcrR family transcriptional regulator [Paenibacillus sp. Y412MC10]|uniref:TetR/AcrR family transcriptional regulator n=1 Tax=Geobacillus sp. (strain Y412MC10) TaxID=481743 RepID=UPI0011AB5E55|nr:TetR/AcrR family transcriptional regulator [Paenibacillus sp. Y412MC10]